MKNILVTGGSKGLGFEIVKLLLKKKFSVYVVNRTITNELKLLKEKYSANLYIKNLDLISIDKIREGLFKDFISLNTKIDGFVNNAAIAYDDIITNLSLEKLDEIYKINVFAPQLIVKYVIRNMIFHKTKGSIVHISSISAHTGYNGLAMYASTKGAIEAFSKNTAREWGRINIRSNCVVPGFMRTNMNSNISDIQLERIVNRTSLKSETDKLSVAQTVEFLLSDSSASITGQNIFVDNGTI